MTHEKKIKALIEAGEKATGGEWREEFGGTAESGYQHCRVAPTCMSGESSWWDDDPAFVVVAANARDSIKLLAEIAEAAVELQTADCAGGAASDRAWAKLDALLAKYKEASNE